MPREPLEDSQNDRTQLNLRIQALEDWREEHRDEAKKDHDALTAHLADYKANETTRKESGSRMWSVALIVLAQIASVIATIWAVKK